jgi:cell division septal protein FtsQ
LEFWVTVEGRKADSDRGRQQRPSATPAEQRSQRMAERKRAAAARARVNRGRKRAEAEARRQAARRRARRRWLLIGTAAVLVVGGGTAGLIYANQPPSTVIKVSGAFGAKPTIAIPKVDPPASLQV